MDKSGFCVLAFFTVEPGFEESILEHAKNIGVLESVAKSNPGFKYLWFNTMERGRTLMRAFQMSDSLPGLMAFNGKKKAYRIFTGPYDMEAINEFLAEVS